MLQLCSCTQSPAAIGWLAKPMIWPNFMTGSPAAIGFAASLWPNGMRWRVSTPSLVTASLSIRSPATRMLSSGLRRSTRAFVFNIVTSSFRVLPHDMGVACLFFICHAERQQPTAHCMGQCREFAGVLDNTGNRLHSTLHILTC